MNEDFYDIEEAAIALGSLMPGGPLRRPIETAPVFTGGSGRRFYRIRSGDRSAVLLVQPGGGEEFDRYLSIGGFLRKHGIGVPEFYGADRSKGLLLMEDLGGTHLEDAAAAGDEAATSDAGRTESLYRRCIETLVRLQTDVTRAMYEEGLIEGRLFDEAALHAEGDYFVGEFLRGYCSIEPPGGFDAERRSIVLALSEEPPVFMHRDFQSRNIMTSGDRIRIVDFQTAHRGPGIYDAASLLKDPYNPLPSRMRRSLCRELYAGLAESGAETGDDFDGFHNRFVLAGIQRNMQALAAFAFLGARKGMPRFLESIPNGLALLGEGIDEAGSYPVMAGMVGEIRKKITRGA